MGKNTLFIFCLLVISIATSLVSLFPNWYALISTPRDKVFTGQASWFDPWDINVYVSAVRSGQSHGILLENLYTSEQNRAILYYPLYTISGSFLKFLNPFTIFYLLTVMFGFSLVLVLGYFSLKILKSRKEAILGVLAIVFGGGFGFLFLHNQNSLDSTMTAFTLQSSFQRAHDALGLLGYCLAIFGSFFWFETRLTQWKISTWIGLLIALIFYPYLSVNYFFISGLYLWLTQRNLPEFSAALKFWVTSLMLAFVIVFAMAVNLQSNTGFWGINGQELSRPNLLGFFVGYGFLFFFFLYHILISRSRSNTRVIKTSWHIHRRIYGYVPIQSNT